MSTATIFTMGVAAGTIGALILFTICLAAAAKHTRRLRTGIEQNKKIIKRMNAQTAYFGDDNDGDI